MKHRIEDRLLQYLLNAKGYQGSMECERAMNEQEQIDLTSFYILTRKLASSGYIEEVHGALVLTDKGREAAEIGIEQYQANKENEKLLQEKANQIIVDAYELQKTAIEENKRSNRKISWITIITLIITALSLAIAALAFYYGFIRVSA